MTSDATQYSGGSLEADHLCVLVHGLWGNPEHMANVARALRAKHPVDKVYILLVKRNSGSFTYDGVELGGERVCLEIEEELQSIERRGGKIKKLSIVGYSHGGLVARYAIGLLSAKGVLDNLECLNFTAFASPFLGLRTPVRGWANHLFNVLGARTLCMSGRQMFGIDRFRNTGRPLLAVLADPNSIFMSGLARFKRRTLYANIINDRSVVYYTSGLSKTNPFTDMSKVKVNYVDGYEDVILDPVTPVAPGPPPPPQKESLRAITQRWLSQLPFMTALIVFVPIGIVAFLINSVIQTVRSSRRVRLHERGLAGIQIENYRMPLWLNEMRGAVEDAYENLNSGQRQEYLNLSESESEDGNGNRAEGSATSDENEAHAAEKNIMTLERQHSHPSQPTLALAPYQFAALQALDSVGWRKYPVWIHKHRHSHAAIIVRMDKPSFSEGRVVLKHWLNEEFLV